MAFVICEQYLPAPGFQNQTVKLLTPFKWKIENGQWMWYVDKEDLLITPFGKISPPTGAPGAPPAAGLPAPPPIPATVGQFFNLIKADKTDLSLKPGASDRVVISNGTPGMTTWKCAAGCRSGSQTGERRSPAGGQAVLTVHAGEQAASGVIELQVKPIGPRISIKVSVE